MNVKMKWKFVQNGIRKINGSSNILLKHTGSAATSLLIIPAAAGIIFVALTILSSFFRLPPIPLCPYCI